MAKKKKKDRRPGSIGREWTDVFENADDGNPEDSLIATWETSTGTDRAKLDDITVGEYHALQEAKRVKEFKNKSKKPSFKKSMGDYDVSVEKRFSKKDGTIVRAVKQAHGKSGVTSLFQVVVGDKNMTRNSTEALALIETVEAKTVSLLEEFVAGKITEEKLKEEKIASSPRSARPSIHPTSPLKNQRQPAPMPSVQMRERPMAPSAVTTPASSWKQPRTARKRRP